jgi:hypothetical protein
LAEEVLGDLEAGGRLRRGQWQLLVGWARGNADRVADDRLTKILVLA